MQSATMNLCKNILPANKYTHHIRVTSNIHVFSHEHCINTACKPRGIVGIFKRSKELGTKFSLALLEMEDTLHRTLTAVHKS